MHHSGLRGLHVTFHAPDWEMCMCWNVLPVSKSCKCLLTYLWRGCFFHPKFIQTLRGLCSRSASIQTPACKTLIGCNLVVVPWCFSWGFVSISENPAAGIRFLQVQCQHCGELKIICKLQWSTVRFVMFVYVVRQAKQYSKTTVYAMKALSCVSVNIKSCFKNV